MADMAVALGVIILAWAFLDLSEEGFLILTGITLALALLVGMLLWTSPGGSDRAEIRDPRGQRILFRFKARVSAYE
jgi:uncharacterized protein (DUF58 family)